MLGLDVRKRSRVFALSPARSGTRVGSEITCVKSLYYIILYYIILYYIILYYII